jgi:hypothetical protein
MESQSGKNIIVGIGMVETRRCTRFDLSQIRFYMMPKHVKSNLGAWIRSWMLRHHLRLTLRHLGSILDGDNAIKIRFYMLRPPSNIESGFDIR